MTDTTPGDINIDFVSPSPESNDNFVAFCESNHITFESAPYMNGCFVVSDISSPHEPIVFVSDLFMQLTGYPCEEILGKKCNFLQGPDTNPLAVECIRSMIKKREEGFVKIVNYRKSGEAFANRLYLCPLSEKFMVGCQCTAPILTLAVCAQQSKLVLYEPESGALAIPNESPCYFETKYIREGSVFIKTVTSPARDARVESYFTGRRRLFDLQLRFQLREEHRALFVSSTLYFAIYIKEHIAFGFHTHVALTYLVSLHKKLTRGTNFITLGDEVPGSRFGFFGPLGVVADHVGQGSDVHLGVMSMPSETEFQTEVRRKKALPGTFLPGSVYTASIHSMFLDFERWLLVAIPGLRAMSLGDFIGKESMKVALIVCPSNSSPSQALTRGVRLVEFDLLHSIAHSKQYTTVICCSKSKD